MAERNYTIPENPEYNPNIRELQDSDPASASGIFNPLLQKIISNIHALKLWLDKKADTGADGKIPVEQLPMDTAISNTSNNPVQNKVVQSALKALSDALNSAVTSLDGKAASNHTHSAATTSAAGFMSKDDKTKLNGIAAKATANTASTTTPKDLGTASAGSESGFARGDHVHPMPSAADVGALASDGNAATATKLKTARTIRTNLASTSTASFNGTANVTPGVTGTLPIANGGTGATTAAEALSNIGAAAASHNHSASNITSGILVIARGGLGNNSGYVRAGQKSGTTIGSKATAEGSNTTSSGADSHAEGQDTEATGHHSHAEGALTTASGADSHAEGSSTTASGPNSHAEGIETTASGFYSHAEGEQTTASGTSSHAEGRGTIANVLNAHACGRYNKEMGTNDAFVIGKGSTDTNRANAFRVTFAGQVYGLAQFQTSGADYAEYFEWLDANPDNEDRVGFFVAMDGEKIRKANAGDYILGIVSGNPCIIGNADEDWLGRYEHDEFNRFKTVEVETPVTKMQTKEVPILDENGEPTGEVRFETEEVATGEVIHGWDYKQNPDYDPTQQYIERKDRQEWSAVGMLGVLSVRDDGSCQVNGFCQCADGGIATAAEKYIPGQTYRVIARVTENIVKVVFR